MQVSNICYKLRNYTIPPVHINALRWLCYKMQILLFEYNTTSKPFLIYEAHFFSATNFLFDIIRWFIILAVRQNPSSTLCLIYIDKMPLFQWSWLIYGFPLLAGCVWWNNSWSHGFGARNSCYLRHRLRQDWSLSQHHVRFWFMHSLSITSYRNELDSILPKLLWVRIDFDCFIHSRSARFPFIGRDRSMLVQ